MTAPIDALPEERQRNILHLLAEQGRVLAVDLAVRFAVSEDSIRRDLRELAARGLCQRVYGGALLPDAGPTPLRQRQHEQTDRKQWLARCAVQLVHAGQTLLIDAGSTNSAIAAALPAGQALTVFTNAPDIAQQLLEKDGITVHLLGGRLDRSTGAALGAPTVEAIRRLRVDLCFPGACAIEAEGGLWSSDNEEAAVKRAMIECSGQTLIVATREKLATSALHHVAPLRQIDHVVVEYIADSALCAAFAEQGVSVHYADAAAG
ncbi:Glycerol-3-phosphate regulon repressor [Andreprevotia sp. IGB-42]|uniref:DeoR/GlpR family DNA-binding transcription regulator n=1 Tax=Andreprevotia sp. IGB-42 TaxID=2497473 RepID=UPI001359CEFA|nr:DeoR/GlpR family DNA-binding transcription regulator [Andreprevotia sp. IGB-42]KAF0811392.1 Glycerol-3-phosphate regulon repressor [Andreprevotia sp. IGB-42]